ncbi:hypothetical protein DLAC_02352 [Tieghemostelium lacteum]|uniref:Prokaryotic-type class I peptide chain release factors domain-containing protein n=1 Tax=Tieghemostelium lacteum TaxID=361077 RepID=A0A152A4S7_TIELA|nr:hypothetical protein DLAC_02352 [Tieghemostelium lacteum]|eukprot:KYR01233.1 hypothetical protein DLAC_02352 [Tieghemostelium lacteum]
MFRFLNLLFTSKIIVPRDKLALAFSRSSGAGGQNVNKVNTKAEIRFQLDNANWIPDYVKENLKKSYSKNLNNDGDFIVTSERHREQKQNLKDCFDKLDEILEETSFIPKERVPTTTPTYAIEKRLKDKAHRKSIKEGRKKPSFREDF